MTDPQWHFGYPLLFLQIAILLQRLVLLLDYIYYMEPVGFTGGEEVRAHGSHQGTGLNRSIQETEQEALSWMQLAVWSLSCKTGPRE